MIKFVEDFINPTLKMSFPCVRPSVRSCVPRKKVLHDREVGSKSLVNEKWPSCYSDPGNPKKIENRRRRRNLKTNLNIWGYESHLAFLNFLIRPLDHGEKIGEPKIQLRSNFGLLVMEKIQLQSFKIRVYPRPLVNKKMCQTIV